MHARPQRRKAVQGRVRAAIYLDRRVVVLGGLTRDRTHADDCVGWRGGRDHPRRAWAYRLDRDGDFS